MLLAGNASYSLSTDWKYSRSAFPFFQRRARFFLQIDSEGTITFSIIAQSLLQRLRDAFFGWFIKEEDLYTTAGLTFKPSDDLKQRCKKETGKELAVAEQEIFQAIFFNANASIEDIERECLDKIRSLTENTPIWEAKEKIATATTRVFVEISSQNPSSTSEQVEPASAGKEAFTNAPKLACGSNASDEFSSIKEIANEMVDIYITGSATLSGLDETFDLLSKQSPASIQRQIASVKKVLIYDLTKLLKVIENPESSFFPAEPLSIEEVEQSALALQLMSDFHLSLAHAPSKILPFLLQIQKDHTRLIETIKEHPEQGLKCWLKESLQRLQYIHERLQENHPPKILHSLTAEQLAEEAARLLINPSNPETAAEFIAVFKITNSFIQAAQNYIKNNEIYAYQLVEALLAKGISLKEVQIMILPTVTPHLSLLELADRAENSEKVLKSIQQLHDKIQKEDR
jgi:hypothetical protein